MAQQRVTEKDLENIARRINRMTGNPETSYSTVKCPKCDGEGCNMCSNRGTRMRANVGNYHISYAYGGAALHQMGNEGGGIRDVLRIGHVPKRELQSAMFAFISGIEAMENNNAQD